MTVVPNIRSHTGYASLVAGPTWTLAIGNWKTGLPERDLTQFTGLDLALPLLEGAGLSCSIPGEHPEAQFIEQLQTDIWAYRNSQLVFRGRVTKLDDNLTPDDHTIDLGCSDYRRLLNRRFVLNDISFTNHPQAQIAWELVGYTQAQTGGSLGIVQGLNPTGVNRDRAYDAGSNIGELLDNLSQVLNGFDWNVDQNKVFNVFYPQRGILQDEVYDYGGAVSSIKQTIDTDNFANAIRVSGSDTIPAVIRTSSGITTDPHGRWEEQFGFPDITVASTLSERADEYIRRLSVFHSTWNIELTLNWWDEDTLLPLQPGDSIRLDVHSGSQNFSDVVRVTEISITIDGDGGEAITLAAIDA